MSGTDTALQISPRILPRVVAPANRTAANRTAGNRTVGNETTARAGGERRPRAAVALVVLIPAYKPDERLAVLVARLRGARRDCAVLVVDDGSGPQYAPFFSAARARDAAARAALDEAEAEVVASVRRAARRLAVMSEVSLVKPRRGRWAPRTAAARAKWR